MRGSIMAHTIGFRYAYACVRVCTKIYPKGIIDICIERFGFHGRILRTAGGMGIYMCVALLASWSSGVAA